MRVEVRKDVREGWPVRVEGLSKEIRELSSMIGNLMEVETGESHLIPGRIMMW